MLRLIYKDLRTYLHVIIFQTLMILFLMSFGIFVDHNGTLTILMLIIYPMSLPTVLLVMDTNYELVFLSLPINRYEYVLSKYLGGLVFSSSIVAMGLLYSYIISLYKDSISFSPLYSLTGLCFLCLPIIIATSLLFPIYFRFSKAQAGIILIISFSVALIGAIIGLVFLENSLSEKGNYAKEDIFPVITGYISDYITKTGPQTFLIQFIVGIIALLIISIFMSLFFVKRKDIGDLS